jgi:hypothetical protein
MKKKIKPIEPKIIGANAIYEAVVRRDVSKNWNYFDPIIRKEEIIYITDLDTFKVGNGKSKFSELPSYKQTFFGDVWMHRGTDIGGIRK